MCFCFLSSFFLESVLQLTHLLVHAVEDGLATFVVATLLDQDGKSKPFRVDSHVTVRYTLALQFDRSPTHTPR